MKKLVLTTLIFLPLVSFAGGNNGNKIIPVTTPAASVIELSALPPIYTQGEFDFKYDNEGNLLYGDYIYYNKAGDELLNGVNAKPIYNTNHELVGFKGFDKNLYTYNGIKYIYYKDIAISMDAHFDKKIEDSECKEYFLSGTTEIKNKNLDVDINEVYFKRGRVTHTTDKKHCIQNKTEKVVGFKNLLLKLE